VKPRVLFVEDEDSISGPFSSTLRREGFEVTVAESLAEARAAKGFDLVLLDLMLPDGDGRDFARELRASGSEVPIIILTARGTELERVVGLELGADDYVVKPFSPAELVARVDAVLRRLDTTPDSEPPLEFGDLVIDPAARRVTVADQEIALTQREFELLLFLAHHPGRAFTRNQLMDLVWRYSFYTDTSTVTVHIRRLRAKIEPDAARPRYIDTVWGVGYRFSP
jgi:DNA-binding response OmpR family regulator